MAKIDVEGLECAVLAGGQSLFQLGPRDEPPPAVLVIETNTAESVACVAQVGATHKYNVHNVSTTPSKGYSADTNAVLSRFQSVGSEVN